MFLQLTYSFSFTDINPCNGEEVTVSGMQYTHHIRVFDANHVTHEVTMANMHQVTGTGSLGNTYRLASAFADAVGVSTNDWGYCDDDECVVTIAGVYMLVSEGSAPNFRFQGHEHITYVNGTAVSVIHDYTFECVGNGPPQPAPW